MRTLLLQTQASCALIVQTKNIMPRFLTPLSAMRTLTRFSRPASRFTTLSNQRPLPEQRLPLRFAHFHYSTTTSSSTAPQALAKSKPHAPPAPRRPPQPEYEMTFTCKPCSTRSTHRVSKQGYHYGSVLITCPECRNRHVISDHLNVSRSHLERRNGRGGPRLIVNRFSATSI